MQKKYFFLVFYTKTPTLDFLINLQLIDLI